MPEYALLVCLLSMTTLTSLQSLGSGANGTFVRAGEAMSGQTGELDLLVGYDDGTGIEGHGGSTGTTNPGGAKDPSLQGEGDPDGEGTEEGDPK